MSLNNGGGGGGGVFARDAHNRFVSTSFDDDALYSPEMDDMLDDRLEEARQNRTNYYRKMLASRSRPLDDYSVSKRVTYRSGNSPAKEPSISDTVPAGPLPQIPEPHSSWRFYTSYDNGEWKRHAVPVHKEEEEILRQPTKSLRRLRETDRVTESPPVESSLRRIRQSGGPLVACLQPRPRRTSEGQKTSTTVHMVNGQPMVSGGGGGGGGAEFVGQFGLPADWADLCGNGAVVRRFSDGGTEYLVLEQEPVQGTVKQEHTTKYTSTVKVTQPNRSQLKQVVSGEQAAGGGGVEDGQGTAGGESGERKSRRPRIYGFQEKIIIPTKYKNAAENQEPSGEEKSSTDINTGQPVSSRNAGTKVETKGSSVEDGLVAKERRVGGGGREVGGRSVVQTTETSRRGVPGGDHQLKIGSVVLDRPVQGKTVKVVVVNSGSDVESSDKKSVELLSSEEDKDALETFPARQLNAGIIQLPNLFQDGAFPIEGIKALHESFHANLLPTASPSKDRAGSVSVNEDSAALIPNQRVFSKDEQTFSEVGPDGAKCDGKVSRTYEVITTTNEEDSTVQNKQLSPTAMVNQQLSPSMEVTVVPVDRAERSSFRTSSISSTGENNITTKPETAERIIGSHFSKQEVRSPPRETTSVVSRKADDSKSSPDIFEQTGSLFKTITPRPRHVREKESVFAAREEHLRKAAGESAQPKSGGITSKTIRISANQLDGFKREPEAAEKASSNVGAAETARTTVKHVLSRNHSLRQRDPPAPAEEELPVRHALAAFETEDRGSSIRSNTNSGVRSQALGDTTQAEKSHLNTRGTDKEWEIQVALKE